jgi:hypothetical protein
MFEWFKNALTNVVPQIQEEDQVVETIEVFIYRPDNHKWDLMQPGTAAKMALALTKNLYFFGEYEPIDGYYLCDAAYQNLPEELQGYFFKELKTLKRKAA